MIKGQDFIITSLQPWDIPIGSNAKDIALEISNNNRVLYVSKINRNGKKWSLNKIKDNLWNLEIPITLLPLNILPDGIIFDFINKINTKRIVKIINKAIKSLEFKRYTLFVDNDVYNSFFMPDMLSPEIKVYYRRDRLMSAYWKKHVPRLEPLLAAKCDCVVANSLELANGIRAYNMIVEDVGQGVNLDAYSIDTNYSVPEEFNNISTPVIGYTGYLTSLRLDADLLYNVAKDLKELNFVFVGPEDDYFASHQLHSLENVYFFGTKHPATMPNYISKFDVCLNPQKVNEITMGNYPRKVDEYLALGKPVVATETATMKSVFGDIVYLGKGIEGYKEAINQAISTVDNKELINERIGLAHSHSWVNSVNKIYSTINRCGNEY